LAWDAGERMHPTLTHEYVHAIVLSRFDVGSSLPTWMMEGLAVWGSDQLDRNAAMLLGNFLRKPSELPQPDLWSPPAERAEILQVDYFMSGVFVSVALPDAGSIRSFLDLVGTGTDWPYALQRVSGRSVEENLQEARTRGVGLLGQVREATRFDEFSDAMRSHDAIQLEYLAGAPGDGYAAWALADLQKDTCEVDDLDRCRILSSQVRTAGRQLSIAGLVRAELNLARALSRENASEECSQVVWDALERGSTRVSAQELALAFDVLAGCHAKAGDVRGFVHAARIASEMMSDNPEYPGLLKQLERQAQDLGAVRELHAVVGTPSPTP
jgi:nucleotide-binding universal stress UspA family protein